MPVLNLGVIDVPYQNEGERAAPRVTKKGRVHRADARRLQREMDGHDRYPDGPSTTVSVATILEERYGVMAAFYQEHQDDVGAAVVNSLEGALEDLYAGAPVRNPFGEAEQEITASFRHFLMSAEIETMGIEGVPTQAAIERRSLRFKKKQGPNQRPSFVDTGTYEGAFRAWVDQA